MYFKYNNMNFSNTYKIYYADDNEIIKSASGEIKNSADFNLKSDKITNSISAGLYDTKIFGAIDKCVCGKVRYEGYCPYCKTQVKNKENYTNQHAYYQFAYNYSLAFKLKILLNELYDLGFILIDKKATTSSTSEEKLINYIWSLEFTILTPNDITKYNIQKTYPQNPKVYEDEKQILYLLTQNGKKYFCKINYIHNLSKKDNIGLQGLKKLKDYQINNTKLDFIDSFINSVMVVKSPILRPPRFTKQNGKVLTILPSVHNDYKISIELDKIIRNNEPNNPIDFATSLALLNIIQQRIMLNSDLLKSSKQSLLRNATNVRVDLALRGNISPDDDLKIDEIGIPKSALYLELQHEIIEELKKNKDPKIALNAEFYYNIQHKFAEDILYKIIDKSVVLFQRSPVLHEYGVFAFKIVMIDSNIPVIKMNPLIAEPFNADYDGDQMPAVLEYDPYNSRRFLQKIGSENVWVYKRSNAPLWVPGHEILIGLIFASTIDSKPNPKKYPNFEKVIRDIEDHELEIDEEIILNRQKTSYGRYKLDTILGTPLDDIIGVGKNIDKDNIARIIAGLRNKKNRVEIMNQLIEISNEFATKIGIDSPPVKNLYKPLGEEINKIKNDPNITDEQKYVQINKYIEKNLMDEINKLPNTNFDILVKSSGRVKMQQLKGLFMPKVALEKNKLIVGESAIMSGLIEKDLYNSAYETRSIFDIKQKAVPEAGYNTRQIVVLTNNISYSPDKAPEKGFVKIPKTATEFQGRNLLRSDNNFNYYQSMIGREMNNKIYSDEIRKELFIRKIKDSYGKNYEIESYLAQSFGMQLQEGISQGLLGLKYGGLLEYTENESTTALFDGEITKIEPTKLTVTDKNGKSFFYPITKASSIPRKYTEGTQFKEGDILFSSNIVRQTKNNMGPISEFLGFQVAGKKDSKEAKAITYAIEDCNIRYSNNYIYIGSIRQKIDQNYIYKYPEGWRVKYGDRVSSGVLSLKDLLKYTTPSDIFYIFYKEFHEIVSQRNGWGRKFEPEFLEPLFAIITQSTGKSLKSMAKERTDIIDSMYGGSPKIAFRESTLNTRLNSDRRTQEFKNSFITDILLRLNQS